MTRHCPSDSLPPSRRTVLKSGLLASTGAILGRPAAATDVDARADEAEGSSGPGDAAIRRGTMFPYQVTPGARVTVAEDAVDWRPAAVAADAETTVVSYDAAPSYRAFLFVESGGSPRRGDTYELGGSLRPAGGESSRPLVGVEAVPLE